MRFFEKLSCLGAAIVIGLTSVMPAWADAELAEYTENEEMMTEDDSKPTLSFDSDKYKDYVSVSEDGKSISGMTVTNDNNVTTVYQGQTLKVNVSSSKDVEGYQLFAWSVKKPDAEGSDDDAYLYPETRGDKTDGYNKDLKYSNQAIVFKAEDFGMTYFDGGMINFSYRINPDAYGLLMDDSVYCYGADSELMPVAGGNSKALKYNDSDSNNVTQYAKCVTTVPDNSGAEYFVISIPLLYQTESIDIFYMDNFTITSKTGLQVMNLDGYNANAKKQDGALEIQITEKKERVRQDLGTASQSTGSKVKHVLSIVGIVAIVIVVAVVGVIVGIKLKNRFY
ncbi:MAG: hypothetical protein IJ806_09645 [Ruminococcus sp.]|nr:hypothetical protein [Ruminococcus sp.]